MILTSGRILEEVIAGRITIDPFDPKGLNPNSYNYHLGEELRVFQSGDFNDCRAPAQTEVIQVPTDGLVLTPGRLYIGHTVERIGSQHYVPSLIGRSSLGRLGMYLQLSADLGNLGAEHQWTLEITVVQPLRIYGGMSCGQVSFWEPRGNKALYDGYLGNVSLPTVPTAEFMKGVMSN